MVAVRTPVEGFTGNVVGVQFTDGVGEADEDSQLAYFARQGYTVGGDAETADDAAVVLLDLTKADLEQIALDEGVEFKAPINKPELVALIEAKRLAATE